MGRSLALPSGFGNLFLAGGPPRLDHPGKPPPTASLQFEPTLPGGGGAAGGRTASGGDPSPAGPFGSSPTTNSLVQSRYTEALVANPLTIIGNSTNRRGWVSIQIDRPSILRMLNATPVSIGGDVNNVVLFHPIRRPIDDSYAMRSSAAGVCYLSHPGTWWVKLNDGNGLDGASGGKQVDFVVEDGSDPGSVMKALLEPGSNGTLQSHNSAIVAAAASNIVTRNRNRRAIWIQTLTPSMAVRITFNDQANAAPIPAANLGLGMRLGGTGPTDIILAGDMNVKGHIQAILDFGVVGPAELEITEFL